MGYNDRCEDEDEILCFVCRKEEGEGIFCSCITCNNYYHLDCYVPTLEKEPSVDWECLLCKEREYFVSLPLERTSSSGNMTKRELHLSRRLVLEMYGVEDIKTGRRASKAFRRISDLEFESYKKIIKDPIALDLIKDRLDKENPDQYKSMSEFMSDFRRMFINCRTYWALNHMSHANAHHSGTIYAKYASLLEKTLDLKRKELTIGIEEQVPTHANRKFSEAPKPKYFALRQEEEDRRRPRMKIGAGKPNEKKEEDPEYKDEEPSSLRSYRIDRNAEKTNINRGIEKAKQDMANRYNRRESDNESSYKRKNESAKRDASSEDGNEDEDDDELLLRKKKAQEMFDMYGEQGTRQSGIRMSGLWAGGKDYKELGGSNDSDETGRFDGNNNSKGRSKDLNERIERAAEHFGNDGSRQRIRATYTEQDSD